MMLVLVLVVIMVSVVFFIYGWEDVVSICVCEIAVWFIVVFELVIDCVMFSGQFVGIYFFDLVWCIMVLGKILLVWCWVLL